MDFFVKHWKVNRSGTLMMLAFQLGLFLMGVVMVLGINAFLNDDQDYAAIGGMMALMGTIFGGLVRGGITGGSRYRMAVSMGWPRLAYILVDPLLTVMNCVVGVAFAAVLNQLEVWLYGVIYPGWEVELNVFAVMPWWAYPAIVLGIALLDFLFGALLLRFGAKGFAAVWFPLCFLPLIIGNSVDAAREGGASLLAQLGRGIAFLIGLLSPTMWAAVGVALVLVLLVLSVQCYRRAEVRV